MWIAQLCGTNATESSYDCQHYDRSTAAAEAETGWSRCSWRLPFAAAVCPLSAVKTEHVVVDRHTAHAISGFDPVLYADAQSIAAAAERNWPPVQLTLSP